MNPAPLVAALAICLSGCGAVALPTFDTASTSPTGSAACTVHAGRADSRCSPGALNPQVTQANIASTICRKGWTATVRPPTSFTEPLKRRQMVLYGETGPVSGFEEDHVIPLVLGGATADERNLFPQPWADAHRKDAEEVSLGRAVCGGRLTLADARAQIVRDWVTK